MRNEYDINKLEDSKPGKSYLSKLWQPLYYKHMEGNGFTMFQ